MIVNRAIATGLREAGLLRRDLTPPLRPEKGGVDWEGVAAMRGKVEPGADAVVCQAGVSLEVMERVRAVDPGATIFLQRDSSHCRTWRDLMLREMDRFGIRWEVYGGGLLEREEREYELADRITVLSGWVRGTFEEHGLGEKVVYVGPQTFDRAQWPAMPPPQGRMFRVLFAGQTGLRKGLFYLLEAWKRLSLRDAQLLVAGMPEPSCPELSREVARRVADTPSCVSLGFVPMHKMHGLYASCHVLCIPSIEEGSTMTALEALSTGRPVVASTQAGVDVLEHGVNGFLVEPGEWEPIADALAWYAEHRDVWREHSEAAPEAVRECDVPRFGRRYAENLLGVLSGHTGDEHE